MAKQPEKLYKVKFVSQSDVYEVYAKSVGESELYGFIEIRDFVFGQSASLVVDPSEERLKTEFEAVESCYIPMHTVLRIDEVKEKTDVAKIVAMSQKKSGNVSQFPSPIYTPSPEN